MKTIIVGLGNPILGDDGVGWRVAEEVKRQLDSPPAPLPLARSATQTERGERCWRRGEGDIAIEFLSLGGISLMERLIGYERAILIDALTSDREPGSVINSELREMPDYSASHTTSAHDTSLQNALELGKAMGVALPKQVIVVGIATHRVYDFSEELSLPVARAISKAAQIVIELL